MNKKKLTPNEMYERLDNVLFNWYSPKNNKFVIQYADGGRQYTFNQPLYEVAYKVKAITKEEYDLFCANDARVVPYKNH